MLLRRWLLVRDIQRSTHAHLPKRERDIAALREVAWYAQFMANHLHKIAEKEARK